VSVTSCTSGVHECHYDLLVTHRRSQGGQRGLDPPKFLENMVFLCFERRVSKHYRVIRLKSNILAPPILLPTTNVRAGHATVVKPHANYSVVKLTAPLAVFTEYYRLLRMNHAKERLVVRA